MDTIKNFLDNLIVNITALADADTGGNFYTAVCRFAFIIIGFYLVIRTIRSLLLTKNPAEVWAYVQIDGAMSIPITHWENVIGRSRTSDIRIRDSFVSKNHGTISRDSRGVWTYKDIESLNGSLVNGRPVKNKVKIKPGDVITIGDTEITFIPISLEEQKNNQEMREKDSKGLSPWNSFIALTLFQILLDFQLILNVEMPWTAYIAIFGITILMWAYFILIHTFQERGFELEILAFFLCTISLANTISANPDGALKQFIAMCLGVALMVFLCIFLKNLELVKRSRNILMVIAAGLLLVNLLFGSIFYGAQNWISIGGITFQPSELVKIVFIIVGAGSLEELYTKKSIRMFLLFSGFCLVALALMGDFGTALVFYACFVVILWLRSGDFSRLLLILGVSVGGGLLLLRFKAHIAQRFSIWGHVWDDANGLGYQQTRTMTATASGGLFGEGPGEGWFSNVFAADTDLVFGVVAQEWGLIIALLCVFIIVSYAIFSVISIMAGRSAYYTIAACAATTMLVCQTILNVFGSIDLLPLTGVTFPLLSTGGTSMIAAWGLLAFLKTADTREGTKFTAEMKQISDLEMEVEAEEDREDELLEEIEAGGEF
ncbi:MAG: FtsW/RodA/SpoVE family cell cycle protein [Clostridia bacterium]|nr:FtsW/RodA/SpoVE family cell cycle protein [Clostridia bacterium]